MLEGGALGWRIELEGSTDADREVEERAGNLLARIIPGQGVKADVVARGGVASRGRTPTLVEVLEDVLHCGAPRSWEGVPQNTEVPAGLVQEVVVSVVR